MPFGTMNQDGSVEVCDVFNPLRELAITRNKSVKDREGIIGPTTKTHRLCKLTRQINNVINAIRKFMRKQPSSQTESLVQKVERGFSLHQS